MPWKPGYTTTEFAVTVLTVVGFVAFAVADKLPARYAALATAVSAAAYALSRGIAKRAAVVTTAPVTVQRVEPVAPPPPPPAA